MLGWSIRARAWRSLSKPGNDLSAVHARLDDLQRHLASHGLGLLGAIDLAETALSYATL